MFRKILQFIRRKEVKPSVAEMFLLSKICSVSVDRKHKSNIIFKDSEGYVVMYNIKGDCLAVDYNNIWLVLEEEGIKPGKISNFIANWFLKYIMWWPEIPKSNDRYMDFRLIKHLNWRPLQVTIERDSNGRRLRKFKIKV
jgi:hypothetical protein